MIDTLRSCLTCAAVLAAALLLGPAFAQTPSPAPPFVYPATIGTSPSQILPANPQRRKLIFHNPNAGATIAYCPAGPSRNNVVFTCAVNGAGSITLFPGGSFSIDSGDQRLLMSSAWNAVASTAGSTFTVLELE